MKRRSYLRRAGVASTALLGGCFGAPTGPESPTDRRSGTQDGTADPSATRETTDRTSRQDWPQHHFDRRNTGYSPSIAGPDGDYAVAWRADARFDSPPTVVGATLYAGASGNTATLRAIDARSGSEQWVARTVNGFQRSAPAVHDGRVYVQDNVGVVLAYDAETGNQLWRYETRFARTASERDWGRPSSPTVVDGTVYVGGLDGGFYALAANDGGRRWQADFEAPVSATPAVSSGTVYVGTESQVLAAIDTESGEKAWEVHTGAAVSHAPTVVGETLFGTDLDGTVYALRTGDGELRWEYTTSDELYCSPSIADGTVYAGSVVLERETGTVVGELAEGLQTHVVGSKRTYAGDDHGVVHAYDRATLEKDWEFRAGGDIGGVETPALTSYGLFLPAHRELTLLR